MKVKQAVALEERSMGRPVKLLASRRLPHDILVIVIEVPPSNPKHAMQIRIAAWCGNDSLFSAIAKQR